MRRARPEVAGLTTETEDGRLVSRPLAAIESEFDGTVWFFSPGDSEKVHQIRSHREVNVSSESIDELWTKEVEAWFEGGKDDPTVALLKGTAHSAQFWASTDPKPVVLPKVAEAVATGGTPEVGENHSVSL
ncbi:MAG: ral stress protein [Naasia sp.]|nr:ral stress protein [Naasia sp.]